MGRKFQKKDTAPKRLGDLFAVYKKRLQAPQRSVVAEACKVINEVVQIEVSPSQCRYETKSRTLVLTTPSALKQEILLHAPEILHTLENRLGAQNTPHAMV